MYLPNYFWPRFGGWLVAAIVACIFAWFYPAFDPVRLLVARSAYADIAQALGYYGAFGALIGTLHGSIASVLAYRRSHYAEDRAASEALEFLRQKRQRASDAHASKQPAPPESAPAAKPLVRIVAKRDPETPMPRTLRK